MTDPLVTVHLLGDPITQGSKTRGRYGMYDDNAKKLHPWRDAVKYAAATAALVCDVPKIEGPVRVEATFTLARPKAAKNRPSPYKRQSGDIDKLVRAVLDALTDAGIWEDDAQVVDLFARKVYPGTHPDALDEAGAVIRIWPVVEVTVLDSTDPGVHDALVQAFTNPPAYTEQEADRA